MHWKIQNNRVFIFNASILKFVYSPSIITNYRALFVHLSFLVILSRLSLWILKKKPRKIMSENTDATIPHFHGQIRLSVSDSNLESKEFTIDSSLKIEDLLKLISVWRFLYFCFLMHLFIRRLIIFQVTRSDSSTGHCFSEKRRAWVMFFQSCLKMTCLQSRWSRERC